MNQFGLFDQVNCLSPGSAEDSTVDDLLANPGNLKRERALGRAVATQAINEVLNWILDWWLQGFGGNILASRFASALQPHSGLVVIAADCSVSAF